MIAFCTTCKGRTQHIEQTLPKNLADNVQYANAKFVILNYNSPDHLIHYLRANYRTELESGRVVLYSFTEPGPFRMAHAKNMAHRLGILEGADILVNLDADNFTGPDFATYIDEQFSHQSDAFLWARMVKEGPNRVPRGCSGRIVVSTQAFMNAGGYDEKYKAYSPDDKDFNARLRRMGYVAVEIDRQYLHAVSHNDKMRFREYPHAATVQYEDEWQLVNGSDNTVVNYGSCGTGVVCKNLDPTPIELPAMPTRVFGIGMHKTATTSLHSALKILGLHSGHWETAHWAKAIWSEMTESGRSKTLEKFYALSDLPISLLYKELDHAYPGSKFILTVRNENSWVRSVERHWSREHNQYRAAWDTDPFTHQVHKLLYGQRGFDAELFLARYRAHNAAVLDYFKTRPYIVAGASMRLERELLVMDMDEGAGWLDLCGFLRKPIPAMPYPRSFATASS